MKTLAAAVISIMAVAGAVVGGVAPPPSAGSPSALAGTSRLASATAFGAEIGAGNDAAVRFVVAWETLEGAGPGQNNPLNSTLDEPGATVLPGNSAGVKIYPSLAVGLAADVATLETNPAYRTIIGYLDQGDLAHAGAALDASPWCDRCPGYGAKILSLAQSYTNPSVLAAAGAAPAGTTTPAVVAGTGRQSAVGAAVVAAARSQLGVPYLWGGTSPNRAFDCSGLAQWVLGQVGVAVPRVAQAQYDAGPSVPDPNQLAPGDLVFFGTSRTSITHVGIYIGAGQMIDAPHTGAVVRVDPIAGFTPAYMGATDPAAAGPTLT